MKINDLKRLYRDNAVSQSDIDRLPESRFLDVTPVTGKCIDVILRVHKAMCRLAPMGIDERRSLWFEAKGRNKKWEWYLISTSVYNDCHYLQIAGDTYERYALCDKEDANNAKNCWHDEDYFYSIMSKIEKFILNLVDNIISDPESYNFYVEKTLSPYRREGLIKRSVLNQLIPEDRYPGIDVAKAIAIYERQTPPTHFTEMTLRTYMHYWRIAYEAIRGSLPGSDIEVFGHSSKGHEVKNYDLDSEADFIRWKKDVSSYHGFDVVYARVHLYAAKDNQGWHLRLGTSSYWNLDQCLQAVIGLTDAGISVDLGETDHILGILKETDYVEITPYAYRYMQGDNVGSQMSLPYPGEDISKETIKKIIANTAWEKIEEASCKPEPL